MTASRSVLARLAAIALFALPALPGFAQEVWPDKEDPANMPGCGGEGCWPVCGCGGGCGCAASTRVAGPETPIDSPDLTSSNIVLASRISLSEFGAAFSQTFASGSDCWGYVSPSGREYAVMGLSAGYAFVEVTNPRSPVIVGFTSKPASLWADVAINGHYAYLVSDQQGVGIKVMDLANIDNGVVTLVNTVMPSALRTVHSANCFNGILYVSGSNTPSNGLLALSLADPVNPTVIGQYTAGGYCHDFEMYKFTSGPYSGKTIAFACMGANGLDIVDYTNTSGPVRLSHTTYANLGYCHQAWYEASTGLLYLNDELDESNIPGVTPCLTRIFDVSDLAAPEFVGSFHIPNNVIDHNNYIRNGFLYQANYRAGLHIFDITGAHALNPVRLGWFDTYPGADALEFNGAWNVYPYLPSGNVLVSDIEGGLFVLDPHFALTGGVPISYSFPYTLPATVNPLGQTVFVNIGSANLGAFDPTVAPTVTYRVDGGAWATAPMTDRGGGQYAARLPATVCLSTIDYYFSAHAVGGDEVREPLNAPYIQYHTITAGVETTTVDDTLESNTGWTVGAPGDAATTGIWEHRDPVGTGAAPEDDHTPVPGVVCFVTGNGVVGGFVGDNDIDGGPTTLISHVFDASVGAAGGDAYVTYWRWYSNDQGPFPNQALDSMIVSISNNNGASWTLLEDVLENAGDWVGKTFRVADYVTPTSQMKLRFVARDLSNGSIVEAGVDDLRVYVRHCIIAGDTNLDGLVNFADLNNVLSQYAQSGAPGSLAGDVNADGIVDFADLNIVLSNFGMGA